MLNMLLMIAISYLMGSIPTSIIAGKLLKGIDIRKEGSGNAGAATYFVCSAGKPVWLCC
ncbi:MAG: glycerol-3-phosphate acyltransferase [Calditrichia bacterium]